MIEVWNCLFVFLQVRVVGLAEPGSPTIMHRSMELRALEQQRFRWMLKKLLCLCEHNTVCAQRYGVLWVSWNDKFCYLYRSSRSFNISPVILIFFIYQRWNLLNLHLPEPESRSKAPSQIHDQTRAQMLKALRQFNFFDWELKLFR